MVAREGRPLMRFFQGLCFQNLTRRFLEDRTASILPLFGCMVIMIVVISGAAFDITRVVNAREKLSYAIDSASLSLASELSTNVMSDDEIEDFLTAYFEANLDGEDFLAEAISNIDHEVDPDEGTVTVSSSARINNYFIGWFGYMIEDIGPDFYTFGANARVNYSSYDVLELALVLDVTGSMRPEMDSLRSAASSVVNILMPSTVDDDDRKIKISLIPYSQGVNLGGYAATVTDGDATREDCVNERDGPQRLTDAVYNYDGGSSEFFHGEPDYFVMDYGRREEWRGGDDACPDSELMPLTSARQDLIDEIEDLEHGGGTGGQTGIAWGWYTLSPNWTPLWPDDSDPEPYTNEDALKFALIMTDGDFNSEYTLEEVETCHRRRCTTEDYWIERYQRYPDYNDTSPTRGRALCDAMKDEGIKIFAVFFNTGGSDFGDDLMEDCSSGAGYYYEAETSDDLVNAFSNIARKIQSVYLSR